MILLTVQLQDPEPPFFHHSPNLRVQTRPHHAVNDRMPVFCDEHQMILQQKTAVPVRIVWVISLSFVHMFVFSFTSNIHYGIIIL